MSCLSHGALDILEVSFTTSSSRKESDWESLSDQGERSCGDGGEVGLELLLK